MYQRTHKSLFHPKTLLHRLVWIKKNQVAMEKYIHLFCRTFEKKIHYFFWDMEIVCIFEYFCICLDVIVLTADINIIERGRENVVTNKKYKSVSERCYKGCDKGWNIGTIYKECVRGACICSYQGSKNPLYYTKYTINRE